jgi:membrane-bound ClpP family serine protease
MKLEKRVTFSETTLKILLVGSLDILIIIALYLTLQCGWPVFVFALIGGLVSLYAEGLLHHESQMAIGAMFLVIGGFYVQAKTLNLDYIIWLRLLCIALFAFLSQYGWLLIYRLDDYKYNERMKNRSILLTKSALVFLVLYFLL